MITRRLFAACALCSATGLVATGPTAQGQTTTPARAPSFTRTVLGRGDLPGSAYETVQVSVLVDPGYVIGWHTHPGIESSTVVQGEGTLLVAGRPKTVLRAGDGFLIPTGTPHALENGDTPMRVAASYAVRKGEPLATPAAAPPDAG